MIIEQETPNINLPKTPRLMKKQPKEVSLFSWLLFAGWVGIMVITLQGFWDPGLRFISNIFVPDSIVLFRGIIEATSFDLAIRGIGLRFIYGPFNAIDPRLIFVPNLCMWLGSIWVAHQLFSRVGERAAFFAKIAIIFNPYLLLSMTGPTKELPLMLLALLFLWIKPTLKNLPIIIVIIALTFLIRDAYAFLMIGLTAIHIFVPKKFRASGYILMALIPLILLIGYKDYTSSIPTFRSILIWSESILDYREPSDIGRENIKRSLNSLDDPRLASREFGFRMLANGYSHLIRPALLTLTNRVSLLGVGYFVHAFFLGIGMTSVIVTLILPRNSSAEILYFSWFVIIIWTIVSLNFFIHPRYLMPITPVAMGIFGAQSFSRRLIIAGAIIGIALAGYFILIYFFNIPQLVSLDYMIAPPFFLNSR